MDIENFDVKTAFETRKWKDLTAFVKDMSPQQQKESAWHLGELQKLVEDKLDNLERTNETDEDLLALSFMLLNVVPNIKVDSSAPTASSSLVNDMKRLSVKPTGATQVIAGGREEDVIRVEPAPGPGPKVDLPDVTRPSGIGKELDVFPLQEEEEEGEKLATEASVLTQQWKDLEAEAEGIEEMPLADLSITDEGEEEMELAAEEEEEDEEPNMIGTAMEAATVDAILRSEAAREVTKQQLVSDWLEVSDDYVPLARSLMLGELGQVIRRDVELTDKDDFAIEAEPTIRLAQQYFRLHPMEQGRVYVWFGSPQSEYKLRQITPILHDSDSVEFESTRRMVVLDEKADSKSASVMKVFQPESFKQRSIDKTVDLDRLRRNFLSGFFPNSDGSLLIFIVRSLSFVWDEIDVHLRLALSECT